jgi:hypothetical protein
MKNKEFSMKIKLIPAIVTMCFMGLSTSASAAAEPTLKPMPAQLETQYALSALPPALREYATVYLLDPKKGYHVSKQGTGGVACLIERTQWELGDFSDAIFIPLCYDAAGTKTYLRVIMDAAALRAQGMDAAALKAEIDKRWKNKTYQVPEKDGLSYMIAPVMRTQGPPDMKVHTMSMPHIMYYAPGITNEDIGARPNLSDHDSLLYPLIDKQGIPEQSYMVQLMGDFEKAKILAQGKPLLDALCAYSEALCVGKTHEAH